MKVHNQPREQRYVVNVRKRAQLSMCIPSDAQHVTPEVNSTINRIWLEDLGYHIKHLERPDYQNRHSLSRFKLMYNNKLIQLMFVRQDTLLVISTVDCAEFHQELILGL